MCVFFWCFKSSVECDRAFIFKCAFTGFDAYQSNSLERLGEGGTEDQLPQGLTEYLRYALFSYLCQECGLNNKSSRPPDFASHLPALLPRHLTKYRPPVVRLTPDLKWNNPWCRTAHATPPFFFKIYLSSVFRGRQAVHAMFSLYLGALCLATHIGTSLLLMTT